MGVLMISDLDVVFSILFMINTYGFHPFLGPFFLFVICVGQLTYLAAVLYFGPKNKFRTMKNVRHMMVTNPDQFQIDTKPGEPALSVDESFPVHKSQGHNGKSFRDLQLD